jgi:hypothetical protein
VVSIIKADNIQDSSGQDLLVNGYPRKPGQIIEVLSSPCDGSSVTVGSGTYTFQNVTGVQVTTTTYQNVTGSVLNYTPPTGTRQVLYNFQYAMRWENEHAISHHTFYIAGVEVVNSRFSRSGRYPEDRYSFEWTMNIGGAQNNNTGRQSTWNTAKELKMMCRRYGDANARNLHATTYWDGAGSQQFSMPVLTITAIA